jgi:cobaltochelatase CobS
MNEVTTTAPLTSTLGALFGFSGEAGNKSVPVKRRIAGLSPEVYGKADPDYHFDEMLLKRMLRFIGGGCARNNVLLYGDAGAGKTSLVWQMAARLGIPVFSISCSKKTRFEFDMVGERKLVNGSSVWQDGPLTKAIRYGGIFLANEITRLDEDEQMRLADVLDKPGRLYVSGTGETLTPHPDFRFIATGNSAGAGDETGCYPGERRSSLAFPDRFQAYKVNYPLAVVEENMLAKRAGSIPDNVRKAMVKLANTVRKQFIGEGGAMAMTFSTRSLIVWAEESVGYQKMSGIGDAYEAALVDTVLSKASRDDRQVVLELWGKFFKA